MLNQISPIVCLEAFDWTSHVAAGSAAFSLVGFEQELLGSKMIFRFVDLGITICCFWEVNVQFMVLC